MGGIDAPITRLIAGVIRGYQLLVSPVLPASCRYYPSCSAYAIEALRLHGARRGGWLGFRRVMRCHPWASGGFDPVPGHDGCRIAGKTQ